MNMVDRSSGGQENRRNPTCASHEAGEDKAVRTNIEVSQTTRGSNGCQTEESGMHLRSHHGFWSWA